ncbi:hypothetical protein [Saccharopolyspora hattusasensis]|uniref:hypothetical protein n=1 Tax=Saccharopolyspora hattusasensis TaxID=1128679 RepID=UPI003D95A9AC
MRRCGGDPSPRAQVILATHTALGQIQARIVQELNEPDPDNVKELTGRLRAIADMLDEHNDPTVLRSV